MADKKFKFHAVNEAAVTQFNKALADEAGQYPGHGTPFLVDELGHWEFPKPVYIAGIDPYKEDDTKTIMSWVSIPSKPKESNGN